MELLRLHDDFNPRSRTGSDCESRLRRSNRQISTHAPRTGSDSRTKRRCWRMRNFNPRSPHGERPPCARATIATPSFQSTLPARGATRTAIFSSFAPRISIHAPRTGSDLFRALRRAHIVISIHAPRTGSDGLSRRPGVRASDFNPRSPHGERQGDDLLRVLLEQFQSTLPARGATTGWTTRRGWRTFQSTLPARGATRTATHKRRRERFQSTLPARGATSSRGSPSWSAAHFNPRSPHGERRQRPRSAPSARHFNPRSPHGERHRGGQPHGANAPFQSTLPARGATVTRRNAFRGVAISIHAPRTGSDTTRRGCVRRRAHFNPRSPHGERQSKGEKYLTTKDFNPRSPHGERPFRARLRLQPCNFNPRSPHGERRFGSLSAPVAVISIHAPRTGSDTGKPSS